MFHKAFTLFELIIVITIISILSFTIIPKINDNSLYNAANQVLFHIRYTQHLALIDNVFDPYDENWFKKRWQIQFHSKVGDNISWSYTIYKDISLSGNANSKKELAKNPMNRNKLLSGGFHSLAVEDDDFTKSMRLGNYYGIEKIKFKNCKYEKNGKLRSCRSMRIAFNYDGSPYCSNIKTAKNSVERKLATQCKIEIYKLNKKITIAIEPETGFAHILK